MSNYHYNDQSGCSGCNGTDYRMFKNVCKTDKLPACMDRYNSERSVKDTMYYNYYVLGKPMHLKLDTKLANEWRRHTYAENSTL